MTIRHFVVRLHDSSSATIDAERYDIGPDGSVTFLVADDRPSAELRAVFSVNARGWRFIECADAGVSFSSAQCGQPAPKPAKVLGQAQIPDPLPRSGW